MSTQRKKSGGSSSEPPAPESVSKQKKTGRTSAAAADAATVPSAESIASKTTGGKTIASKTTVKKSAAASAAKAASKTATKTAAPKKTAAKKAAAKKTASASRRPAGKADREERDAPGTAPGRPIEDHVEDSSEDSSEDPIGNTSDGEAERLLAAEAQPEAPAMMEAYRADTAADAEPEMSAGEKKPRQRAKGKAARPEPPAQGPEGQDELEIVEAGDEESRTPRPEPQLERLQKILAQAGIASRRHSEEMITAGRVMVNGQVVSQLGAKADPARDHIRVDGKLIQVEVRHRTFALNKPKGYVTTVSDPEGRPTVMQFFEKIRERLYPVGRLDFQSEGLLLMTNDGELANQLTRAASGVEKTYLVKVSGQPGDEALEQLRGGVSIEREQPGSGRVRTAPAQVRQIRSGDNPWFEVVLTEGRNRELRKMFNAVGHFVEKIRRVGYGPLVLDLEPGQMRELTAEEVNALRLTATGKLKPKRPRSSAMLPKEAGRPAEEWQERGREGRPQREARPFRPRQDGPRADRPRDESPSEAWPRPDRVKEARPSEARPWQARPRPDAPRPERSGFQGRGPDRPRDDSRGASQNRSGDRRFGSRPPRSGPGGFERRPPSSFGGARTGFGGARAGGPRGSENGRPQDFRGRDRGPDQRGPDRGPDRAPDRAENRGPAGAGNRPSGFGAREGSFSQREGGFGAREQRERRPRFDGGARQGGGFRPQGPRGEGRGPRYESGRESGRESGQEPGREERPAGREFRPREGGAPRSERPQRFGGEQRRGAGRPQGRSPQAGRAPRSDGTPGRDGGPRREAGPRKESGPRREGSPRFGAAREGRPSSGPRGGASRPGGARRPGNGPRGSGFRKGGPPRRGRG